MATPAEGAAGRQLRRDARTRFRSVLPLPQQHAVMPVASKLVDVCRIFAHDFTDDHAEVVSPVLFTRNLLQNSTRILNNYRNALGSRAPILV